MHFQNFRIARDSRFLQIENFLPHFRFQSCLAQRNVTGQTGFVTDDTHYYPVSGADILLLHNVFSLKWLGWVGSYYQNSCMQGWRFLVFIGVAQESVTAGRYRIDMVGGGGGLQAQNQGGRHKLSMTPGSHRLRLEPLNSVQT